MGEMEDKMKGREGELKGEVEGERARCKWNAPSRGMAWYDSSHGLAVPMSACPLTTIALRSKCRLSI